jgi:hypothetical protein
MAVLRFICRNGNKPGGVTQQSNFQLLSTASSAVAFCILNCMLWDMGSNKAWSIGHE